jgi:hypothetical protein
MKNGRMWIHYCLREHDLVSTERGCECNWCGAKAKDVPVEREPVRLAAAKLPVRNFIATAG